MRSLKIVIIDDEPDAIHLLQVLLAKVCPHLSDISAYTNPAIGLENIRLLKPDLLFLDIDMPTMNGFELLENLMPFDCAVIFTTAYNQYALKAFKFNALDYLVKPIDTDELLQAIKRVEKNTPFVNQQFNELKKQFQGQPIDKMAVSTTEGISFISLDDIVYAESDSNYSVLILKNGKRFVISKTLKDLQDLLEQSHFLRVHRQYIINLNDVQHLDRTNNILTMSNLAALPVSRDQKDRLIEMYKWL